MLVARGTSAGRLASEAAVDQRVTVRLILRPQWGGVVDAVGGGPVIVQDGRPVFRALEDFTSGQLSLRNPRTAVGQKADGGIILVAVDGRQPGYSTGLTNFELAQTMVRLGAETASALDAGGSTTMAFDGELLNRPSDPGGERPVADGLFVFYYGVHAPPPTRGRPLTERRRRRRVAVAELQDRATLDGHCEPRRSRPGSAANRDRRARTGHLQAHVVGPHARRRLLKPKASGAG